MEFREFLKNLFLFENIDLKPNSKYIILENDHEVDPEGHKILSKIEENYSSLTALSKHSKEEIENVLKNFKENGGETVYVYTTGQNVNQMYEYTDAIINAGINNMKIDFNLGIKKDHKEFLETFKNDINIESRDLNVNKIRKKIKNR